MNSLTIRIEPGTVKHYQISLLEGAPAARGAQVLAKHDAPALNAKALRKQVLSKSGDPARFGERLGQFLLGGQVGVKWDEKTSEGPTRTYLDVRPPELDGVPWEAARRNATLFLEVDSPFVQFRRAPARAIAPEWGIRVLLVVAAKDKFGEISIRDEITAIRTAIRSVNRIIDVDLLNWPSRVSLKERIEKYRPHILHIIGHGDAHGLQLYDGTEIHEGVENLIPWGAVEVNSDLASWKWKPELVYLNTCRSASDDSGGSASKDSSGSEPKPPSLAQQTSQWSVAGRFLQKGCSAVIAMHANVRGPLAGAGAAAFYAGLAEGATVDVALAAGRLAIAQRVAGGQNSFDPYLPRLVVMRPVDEIVRHRSRVKIEECPDVAAALKTFVDRDEERRQLVSLLESDARAVVITGDPEIGKSWLLQWCMDAWLRRRMEVRYVEIAGCETWLDVVRCIRDRSPRKSGSVHQGLSAEAGALLNWRLNALARGIADPPADSFTGSEKEGAGWAKALVDPQAAVIDAHIKAMDALQGALHHEARGAPLVIVLDNFGAGDIGLAKAHFAVLCDHWVNNLVVRASSEIRVVLGLNSRQLKKYELETLPDGFKPVLLKDFPSTQFADLMLELLPLTYSHEIGENSDGFHNWAKSELVSYDPGRVLTGSALREECKTIWDYAWRKKQMWERA